MDWKRIFRFLWIPLFVLAALLVLLPGRTMAKDDDPPTSGVTGGCGWSFDEASGTLSIWAEGDGVMPDYEYYGVARYRTDAAGVKRENDVPWNRLRTQLQKISISADVKYIGEGAFCYCYKNPLIVTFAGSVKIGKAAFWCSEISDINFEKITEIGEHAFENATLPDHLTINARYIGLFAFSSATMNGIEFGPSVRTIDAFAFTGYSRPVNLGKQINGIGLWAFGYSSRKDGKNGFVTGHGDPISSFKIYAEDGASAVEEYANQYVISVSVIYGKKYYLASDGTEWTFESATGTLEMNSADRAESSPSLSDDEWSRFLQKDQYNVKKLILKAAEYSKQYEITDSFSGLKNMQEIRIEGNRSTSVAKVKITGHAFENLSIRKVTVACALSSIGESAFAGCSSLKEFDCEEALGMRFEFLTEIGAYAFQNCYALKDVSFLNVLNNTSVGDYAFSGCGIQNLILEGSVGQGSLSFGRNVFDSCNSLKSVAIGDIYTEVPEGTFENCRWLESFEYSDQLSTIGNRAFKNCQRLKELKFRQNITTIGAEAFAGTGLNAFLVPDTITEIGTKAFCFDIAGGSLSLKEDAILYVTEGSEGLSYAEENQVPYEVNIGGTQENCEWRFNPETGALTIAGSGEMATYTAQNSAPWTPYANRITSITIGQGMTSVSRKAFYAEAGDYKNLESLVINSSVENIGVQAFYNCPLKTIELSAGVKEIGRRAIGYRENAYGEVYLDTDLIIYVEPGSTAEEYVTAQELDGKHLTYEYSIYNGTTGDCSYHFDKDSRTLTISGSGSIGSYTYSYRAPWYPFREDVGKLVIEEGVTSIGTKAFMGFSHLKTVILPETLTEIGDYAFAEENAVEHLYVPEGVSSIGQGAIGFVFNYPDTDDMTGFFRNKKYLYSIRDDGPAAEYADGKNVYFTQGRAGLCGDCFWTFNSLTGYLKFEYGETLDRGGFPWMEFADEVKTVNIGNYAGIHEIPDHAFANMKNLASVSLNPYWGPVDTIGKGAFEGDSALTGIQIPYYVREIQEDTFRDCTSLTSVSIYKTRFIGSNAFRGCTNLTTAGLDVEWLETIADSAFEGCESLSNVRFGYRLSSIGERAFKETGISTLQFSTSTNINIGAEAFLNTPMTFVEIPRNINEIGASAFGYQEGGEGLVKTEGFTVSTPENTAAHTYAVENGFLWENPNAGDLGEVHWDYNDLSRELTISGSGMLPDDASPWDKFGKNHIYQITVKNGITGIGARTFDALTYDYDAIPIVLKMSGSVESIGESAFEGSCLADIKIPAGVISIGDSAFKNTYVGVNEGTITLSRTVKEIGTEAFLEPGYYDHITSVMIPAGVTSIGEHAFGFTVSNGLYRVVDGFTVTGERGSEAEYYANLHAEEGMLFEEYIPEAAPSHIHSMTYYEQKEPTAAAEGYISYYECEECGEWFEDAEGTILIEDHKSVILPKLSLNYASKKLKAGKTVTLKTSSGTIKSWKSSNSAVASVSSKGVVTAKKKGSATITATLANGTKLTCKITVSTNPTIKIGKKAFKAKTTYTVKKGKTLTVTITGKAASIKNVYATSKKKIAKVTSKNTASKVKIKGLKAGTATVTIKVNGVAFKIKVKVK